MPGKVRRIVTGHDQSGRSTIISDTLLPERDLQPGERVRANLWMTDRAPASNEASNDPFAGVSVPPIHPPGRGGTVFRIVDVPPDGTRSDHARELAGRGAHVTPDRSARHPGFHRTDTLDYAICLEGEIWAILDEAETLMKPGDILIQRGTYHAWSNRGDKPCRMAFILIDAESGEEQHA